MILISKQISSVHPRLCRRVWPGKAGHEVLSQFLSSFRKFEKSCVQWERRTDQCTGLTDQSPVSGDMCWPCPDHWVPPSPHSCPHWPALAPDVTCASLVSTDHSPEPLWLELTTGDWWPVLCARSLPPGHVSGIPLSLRLPLPSLWCKWFLSLSLSLSLLSLSQLSQLFVPHRPRMPLVSCEMEYSETENRLKIELIIDKMRREICTIWHQSAGTGWVWRSAQSPRPELKITAALSGLTGNWKMFSILGRDSCNPNTSKKSEIEKLHFDNIFSKWS